MCILPKIYQVTAFCFLSKVTAYNCSKTCKPGYELRRKNDECCNSCVLCADGDYSEGNGKCDRLFGLSEVTPFADDTSLSTYDMISYTSWGKSRRNSMKIKLFKRRTLEGSF